MTKLYGYDGNDDGIMLNKRIYLYKFIFLFFGFSKCLLSFPD